VVGPQPGVEHFNDGDAAVTKNQRVRSLLAAMAGVTLHIHAEQTLFH
jgi:hypothetical protein